MSNILIGNVYTDRLILNTIISVCTLYIVNYYDIIISNSAEAASRGSGAPCRTYKYSFIVLFILVLYIYIYVYREREGESER